MGDKGSISTPHSPDIHALRSDTWAFVTHASVYYEYKLNLFISSNIYKEGKSSENIFGGRTRVPFLAAYSQSVGSV